MGTLRRNAYPRSIAGGTDLITALRLILTLTLMLALLLLTRTASFAITKSNQPNAKPYKSKTHQLNRRHRQLKRQLTRVEIKEAERRLSEMGYGTGRVDGTIDGETRNALIAFQKWEGRKVTGRMSREDFDLIMNANAPQPKDAGYKHAEVDLDRQVLLLIDDEGVVERVLPISSGSNKQYNEKGGSGLAYTPRGRFRIEAKISGWRKSPLGLLYYPSYFSGGTAIHGNPSVPHNPQSHGCIRIPMSAAVEVSRRLPLGTIVLIYDKQSFVSAKDWVEADKRKQEASIR